MGVLTKARGGESRRMVPAEVEEDSEQHQFLTFSVAGEAYAIGILNIKEIIKFTQVTPVPLLPTFIRGVINLRGEVVPVIDLAARFGHPLVSQTRSTCVVILDLITESEHLSVGVLVESVSEVVEIPPQNIGPAPAFGAKIRTDFIEGMGKLESGFVILLDIAKVFSMDEIAALAQAGPKNFDRSQV
ncbi:purine-binding chemotaxis protein CheW [Gammaproteobacteria bacterium]